MDVRDVMGELQKRNEMALLSVALHQPQKSKNGVIFIDSIITIIVLGCILWL